MARTTGGKWITKARRWAIYVRDRFTCVWCGVLVIANANTSNPRAATLDHLKPLAKGGALRDPSNLVCACARCNSLRRDMRRHKFAGLLVDRAIVEPGSYTEIKKEIRRRRARRLDYAAARVARAEA